MMPSLRRTCSLAMVVTLAAVSGCIRGTIPAREMYRLTLPDSVGLEVPRFDGAPTGGGGGSIVRPVLDGTLGVVAYETPGLYGESSIVFRLGDGEYGAYPSREWALPLGDMLGHITARIAAGHGLTRDLPLYAPPSPRSQTYLWRARVREFEEVDRGKQVFVSVRIDASIVRTRDDSVVWSATAGRERPVVPGNEMSAVVRTMSVAAASVLDELLDRAEQDLARPGGARPPAADTARRAP
jgi:ABC-type uncharacterized transport system auxiliary subunit